MADALIWMSPTCPLGTAADLGLTADYQLVSLWLRETGGNVTIIFSLALLVMMGIAGAAVDYIRLIEQRTVFAAAADSAVLAAISSRARGRAQWTGRNF